MNKSFSLGLGLSAILLSSAAYAVADSCDAFGLLEGSAGMEGGDRYLYGTARLDYFGQSTATGDFDGDGNTDLLVGAPGADFAGSLSGAVYLFYGPISAGTKLNANSADVLFAGEGPGALAGASVASAGDVDNDGFDDILIGSIGGRGTVHPAGAAHLIRGGPLSGFIPLSIGADAKFTGLAEGDELGTAVSGVGDINSDGYRDIAIGAPNQEVGALTDAGATYVWFGPISGTQSVASADISISSAVNEASFGSAIAPVGDIDGDGVFDLLIGAPRSSVGGPSAGAAYLFLGAALPPPLVTTADAIALLVGDPYARAGSSLSPAGDLDHDGFADYWVGARQQGALKKGAVYLVNGYPFLDGAYPLEAVHTAKLIGQDSNDLAGSSVVGNIDFNGDGIDDVLVGGERADYGAVQSGAAWVVHGPFGGSLNLANADAKIGGAAYLDYAGHAVAAGDLNSDGFADAVVGAWQASNSTGGLSRQGQVSAFFGGEDVFDLASYYADADNDGYGAPGSAIQSCTVIAGRVLNDDDCRDSSAAYHPAATEACVGPDTNCDGFVGNVDHDGDGVAACAGDCNDGDVAVKPSASEVCGDATDNDCDGLTDDSTAIDAQIWAPDADRDGFGSDALSIVACEDPGVFLTDVLHIAGDCDDTNFLVTPAAPERCDLVDNNCDGSTDDTSSIDAPTWFADDDNDNYGNFWDTTRACVRPAGYVGDESDCDDTTSAIRPGATEVCDFADNNCNGVRYLGGPVVADHSRAQVTGVAQEDEFGDAVLFLPDQNSDGRDELVIGAPRNDGDGGDDRGAVYIVRGHTPGGAFPLGTPYAAGVERWSARIRGTRNFSRFGATLATGDLNGDGRSDLVVGAEQAPVPGQATGAVYVFYGPIADGDWDVTDANLTLKGGAANDLFGAAIAVGDVDNDGYDDLVASAPGYGSTNTGRVYLVYGSATRVGELGVQAVPGLATFTGNASNDEAGSALAITDLDGDGFGDVVIGSGFLGALDAGAVQIRYGQATRLSGAFTPTATIAAMSDRDKLGLSAAAAGDVNNDGYGDLIVGSDNNAGYLFWGSATRLASGPVNTAAAFIFNGQANQSAGEKVAGVGDVDGDGYDDLLLSAVRDDDGGTNAGAAYLVYGNSAAYFNALADEKIIDLVNTESFGRIEDGDVDNFPTYSAANLGGVEGAKILGAAANDSLGRAVGGGGDFNGDGRPDLAVGATQVDAGAVANAGAAYVLVGGAYGTDDAPVAAQTTFFWDSDADSYANEAGLTFVSCPMHAPISFEDPEDPKLRGIPVSASPPLDDCDDADADRHPGAFEQSNDGIDADCDGYDNNNRDPIVSVSITPSPAYTDSTLTAAVNGVDPDGDTLAYTYVWRINGAVVVGQTAATLASTFFDKGDVVEVSVMVDDGREVTGPFTEDVDIRNSKPTLTSCAITPTAGGTSVDWAALSVGLTDADPEDAGLLTTSVRWEKRFGPLWRAIPGETGTTLASCTDRFVAGSIYNCVRADQIRAVCNANDSYDLGPDYASDPVTIANEGPTVTQCTLSPAAPDTLTDITVTAAGQDPDGDPLTFSYVWYRNGVLDGSITGTTWPASSTDHFDVLQVRCTATDSQGTSSPQVSSTPITVVNTPPGAPVIDLTPNAPQSNQDLTVSIVTPATDVDGDVVTYDLYWTRNGSVFANPTNPTTNTNVDASATTRGETWEVTAVSNDGFSTGGADNDFVVIQNTPPTVASAFLSPSAPTTITDITAFGIDFEDDDGDPEDYIIAWYINGAVQPAQTPDPLVLGNASIVRGNTVYAVLTARDPFTTGNTVTTTTVTVVNAKPTAPVLAITPSPPGDGDTLSCSTVTASTDADGDTITTAYAWYRNGVIVAGQTLSTFPSAQTSIGDVFYCTVTPHDGIEAGDIGTSPTIAIQDTNAPPAPVISPIYRYNNTTSDTISGTCVSGATDCNSIRITCNDGVSPDTYNTTCTGNAFSQVVSTDRGLTTSCSAICIDNSNNQSAASNVQTKTSCDPFDSYETSGNYGDVGTNPIILTPTLADNNAASISVVGNVVAFDTVDWYRVTTTDNAVADAIAGANTFKLEVEMTAGDADYNIWVYKTNPAGTPFCVTTGPYDNFSIDWQDQADAPNHPLPGNLNACTSNGSAVWSLYNQCSGFGGDYFVRVLREFDTDCQHYQLRVYNGRP